MVLGAYGKLGIQNDKLVQACKKQVRSLAHELTHADVAAIEAGLRALGSLDATMEAQLRRVRRRLAEDGPRDGGASRRGATAPGGDDEALANRLRPPPPTPLRPLLRLRLLLSPVFIVIVPFLSFFLLMLLFYFISFCALVL